LLPLGQVASPHGVRGAVKVNSWTDPPENLLRYQPWLLVWPGGRSRQVTVLAGQRLGRQLRVELEGVGDRDAALALGGAEVQVPREALPPTAPNEHYRDDLIGFEVVNEAGSVLGTLSHFLDLPGGAVMVVSGQREHLVPAQPPHLRGVDIGSRRVQVDWPEDF
jgi:16S rRNA processing protein RimM